MEDSRKTNYTTKFFVYFVMFVRLCKSLTSTIHVTPCYDAHTELDVLHIVFQYFQKIC